MSVKWNFIEIRGEFVEQLRDISVSVCGFQVLKWNFIEIRGEFVEQLRG